MKKNKIIKVVTYLIYVLLIFFTLSAISSKISAGGLHFLTVQSGSMEPTIKMGSLVIVKKQTDYKVDDIITFYSTSKSKETTTHRIVNLVQDQVLKYQTQGDANGTPDGILIPKTWVVGKVISHVTYLGYPISFSRTLLGLVILIVIPATIIIYEEIKKIKKEWAKLKQEKKNKDKQIIQIESVKENFDRMTQQSSNSTKGKIWTALTKHRKIFAKATLENNKIKPINTEKLVKK